MSVPPNLLPDSITKDTLAKMMQDALNADLARLPDIPYPKERALLVLAESNVANSRAVNKLHSLGDLYQKILNAFKYVKDRAAGMEKTNNTIARLEQEVAVVLKDEEQVKQDLMLEEDEDEKGRELEHEDLSAE